MQQKDFKKETYSIYEFINKKDFNLLPCWGTTKKSPSALQKAQLSIDLLAVYLHVKTILLHIECSHLSSSNIKSNKIIFPGL